MTTLKLQYQSWGDPTGHKVLAIHGWLDNSASFAPLGQHCQDIFVVAPDLLGHGLSNSLPDGLPYSFSTYVISVGRFLDDLGWDRVDVIGHSLGAGIAAALAASLPSRIGSLILIDGLGPPIARPEDYTRQLRQNLRCRQTSLKSNLPVYRSAEEAAQVRSLIAKMPLDAARLIAERDLLETSTGLMSRSDPRLHLKSHLSATAEQVQVLLESIESPTLLIKPDAGFMSETSDLSLAKHIRNFQVAEISGGHHAHMSSPRSTMQTIRELLGSRPSIAGISCEI